MKCLACGNQLGGLTREDFRSELFADCIEVCQSCGCGTTNVEKLKLEVTPEFRRFGPFVERCLLLFRLGRAVRIALKGTRRKNKTILDYGCGRGEFLSLMRKLGWQVQGTEYSVESASEAKKRSIPVDIYENLGREPVELFPDNSFCFITSFHNLEHLVSPRDFIKEAHKKITSDGELVIEVPNFDAVQSRLAHRNWILLDPSNHKAHFTRKGLELMLLDAGFKILSIRTFSIQYGVVGMIEALRLSLFRNKSETIFNQLHNKKSSDLIKTFKIGIEVLFLLIPGVVLEALSALRGEGAVLRVISRKL